MPVRHATLVPNVVSTVTVPGDFDNIGVLHTANVTADVNASVALANPVADADDTYLVPAGTRREIVRPGQPGWDLNRPDNSEVRLLSTGAVKVEVEFS